MTDPASRPLDRRQVAAARLWAAHRFPYLASALFAAPVLETPGSGGVAADPSWRMYVDPDAVADWSPDELGSVMVHLVGHFLRDHGERAQAAGVTEADAAHWTDSADAEINDDFGSDPTGPDRARNRDGGRRRGDDGGELHFPERPVLPEDLGCERGGLAERYFVEGSRREAECWACASAADGQGRPWEGQGGPAGVGRNGQQLLRRQVAGEVLARQRQAGNVPEGLRRWAEDVLGARVDWRKTLAAELRRGITEVAGAVDYSYRRPSRRSTVAGDVVLPSLRRPVPHVAVVCDTSGPMSPTITRTPGGGAGGQGVAPSVSTTTTWGRGRSRAAASIPTPMLVPPPPSSSTWRAEVTRWAVCTAASTASTRTAVEPTPTARSTPSTSASTRPRSDWLIEPEVSHTTATWGTGRRNDGSTTSPATVERRDGRR